MSSFELVLRRERGTYDHRENMTLLIADEVIATASLDKTWSDGRATLYLLSHAVKYPPVFASPKATP